MPANAREVHARSDLFKRGWVKGFYDCRNDDGARDGGRGCASDEERAGYVEGRLARIRPANEASVPAVHRRHADRDAA
jgi:hypothetical protein